MGRIVPRNSHSGHMQHTRFRGQEQRRGHRGGLINRITQTQANKVLAVAPLSHIEGIRHLFLSNETLAIELRDSVQHIFDRLVFSDENDHVYKDDEYKNKHRAFYISEIKEDISWYGRIYAEIKNKFDMGGNTPEAVVDKIIRKYHLDRNETIGQ
jgi:hypothetical protein